MRAFTRIPYQDQIAPATPADVVPTVPHTPTVGTPSLGSAPLGAWTPAPWVADLDGIGWQPGNGQEDHNEICCLGHTTYDAVSIYAPHLYPPSSSYEEFSANARLISLAPELAESVRDLLAEVDEMEKRVGWAGYGARSRARALLSKLKGS